MSKTGKLLGNVHGPEGSYFYVNSASGNRAHDSIEEDIKDWGGRVTLPSDLVEAKAIVGNVNIRLNIAEAVRQITGTSYGRSSCFTIMQRLKAKTWRGVPYVLPDEIYAAAKAHIQAAKLGRAHGLPNLVRRVR